MSHVSDNTEVPSGLPTRPALFPLWKFLIELMTDSRYDSLIQWHDSEGTFKLLAPEAVATLWGKYKHRPTMNYEKLSRALRYYYDEKIIAKVPGERYVYRFICDLRHLVGFTVADLQRLKSEGKSFSMVSRSQERSSDLPLLLPAPGVGGPVPSPLLFLSPSFSVGSPLPSPLIFTRSPMPISPAFVFSPTYMNVHSPIFRSNVSTPCTPLSATQVPTRFLFPPPGLSYHPPKGRTPTPPAILTGASCMDQPLDLSLPKKKRAAK